MKKQHLDEREFELINIIGGDMGANQRDLAKLMNLSLGMVNMLVRRLLSKGHIRIEQLDKKKVRYILTPQGFAEKMQKSVKYALKTINSIGLIRQSLKKIVQQLHQNGTREFTILGDSDLTVLVEMALAENCNGECQVHKISLFDELEVRGVLLICKEGYENGQAQNVPSVNLLEELVKDNVFV